MTSPLPIEVLTPRLSTASDVLLAIRDHFNPKEYVTLKGDLEQIRASLPKGDPA
jgi:hypothetical protein